MRSSVPPEMAAHKTATAVAVLCAAISGGTLHLTVEHLQRMPKTALCGEDILSMTGETLLLKKKKRT